MSRQDHKLETLMTHLSSKTEKNKSVIDLEEKVRQDMSKSNPVKRLPSRNLGRSN